MSPPELNRDETPPFLMKLFYRTGAFHRPDEFNTPSSLPPHLPIHTWTDCTLSELSDHILDASPPILPDPATGTRLSFCLIYADTRGAARMDAPPRYVSKVLGTVVLGRGGPGAGPEEGVPDGETDDGALTLAEARFITGDFICCAILPPDELTGHVAPASSARIGRGAGVGEARGQMMGGNAQPPQPPPFFSGGSRQRDYGPPGGFRGRGSRGGGSRGGYGGGGRFQERDEPFGRGGVRIPDGEWRRGDRLPDDPPEGGRWGR
ncbi:Sin3 associated polypeptide p18-domain-containing protein [Parachaetomium inaequale]|uniref:Sin3 associated polypeptide p18-domain-containing protein n=1 Tax=Parachaetomium inaequale TaxID=2588326 RepID=A0AAN6SVP3_9PEZI|nr:Sin3 associated polypeptide p18-domain-containing protein [Parachaetomium inaequale]